MGILELVIPGGGGVSDSKTDKGALVTGRRLQQGMPMPDGIVKDESYTGQLLFQQYLMNKLGNYREPSKGGLRYQIEYILAGKDNDVDNLKETAKKLLLVREGLISPVLQLTVRKGLRRKPWRWPLLRAF